MQLETLGQAVAARVLPEIPKLLTLLDRTPVSPTYGCFDRAYWHYRTIDFPCGMSQEFVLPLALVWSMADLPDNPYHQQPAICEWVIAGIRYAARSSHPDGSCDDYYPFERAAGAAAFSLFAMLEAADILDLPPDPEIDALFRRRANWLATHEESGRLSNHEALICACLERARIRYPEAGFERALDIRLKRLLSWQDSEGWFDEYGGAELGYLSLTIGLLSDFDRRRPELGLRAPLESAIGFLQHFVHPDGSVGGEYSSRSTLNFFPFGFEIAGAWHPTALAINNLALRPLIENRVPCYSDDRIIGHHLWGWLLTLRNFCAQRPDRGPDIAGRRWFPNCRLLADRGDDGLLVAAPGRGGVFKLYGRDRLLASDTGVTLKIGPSGRVAVTHLGGSEVVVDDNGIVSSGAFAWAKVARLTPLKNVILRLIMLGLGRFFPDLVRRLLQKLLVTGKTDAPFHYRRTLRRSAEGWIVRDEITSLGGWDEVTQAGISGHQTSITTIMARVYHADQLAGFHDLTAEVKRLKSGEPLVVERRFDVETGLHA